MQDVKTKRPSYYDDEVTAYVAEKLADDVTNWLDVHDENWDQERIEVVECLKDEYHYGIDAYDFAKELEWRGFDCDRELVEILDDAGWYVREIHKKRLKEWVEENDVRPPYEIGNHIRYKWNNKEFVGEIYEIDDEEARFNVCCRDEGHVLQGSDEYKERSARNESISLGHCVDYDSVLEKVCV